MIAVKPQDIEALLGEIGPLIQPEQTVLSIAAAIPTAAIERHLGSGVPVVRAMPNTPAVVHEGMAGICAGSHAGEEHLTLAEEALRHLGAVVRVSEPYMDAVTAVSGSGPAYFALLAEAMIEAGILLGLSREISTQLVVQTMLGTAKQLRDLGMHPVELREMVTSPGGTTIAAIRELEQAGVRAAFLNAIQAAMDRSRELARGDRSSGVDDPHRRRAGAARRRLARPLRCRRCADRAVGRRNGRQGVRARCRAAAGVAGVHVWFGDERAVPPEDERSNYRLVQETLLDRLDCRPKCTGSMASSARRGCGALRRASSTASRLDLALNGIGPDGHTASLFPDAPALDERERRAVAAEPGLEPFVERVTLTPPVFAATRLLVYLVTGESKAEAVRRAFAEEPSADTPASLIRGVETIAILDPAAASLALTGELVSSDTSSPSTAGASRCERCLCLSDTSSSSHG